MSTRGVVATLELQEAGQAPGKRSEGGAGREGRREEGATQTGGPQAGCSRCVSGSNIGRAGAAGWMFTSVRVGAVSSGGGVNHASPAAKSVTTQ